MGVEVVFTRAGQEADQESHTAYAYRCGTLEAILWFLLAATILAALVGFCLWLWFR